MEKPNAFVDSERCLACGGCISLCPQNAIAMYSSKAIVRKENCIYCGICIQICPVGAISDEVYS